MPFSVEGLERNISETRRLVMISQLRSTAHAWLFFTDDVRESALREKCLAWLSAPERAGWKSLATQSARRDYLAAHALCRATLSRYTSVDPARWRFGTGPHGKPTIVGPSGFEALSFNLSHADGLVVCLVSCAGDVGVDVENTSHAVDVEQVARHFLSRAEQARLARLPAARRTSRFFKQWVLREAYLKGTGKGIGTAPERFTIKFTENGRPLAVGGWRLFLHRPSPKYVAAAAVRARKAARIQVQWFQTRLSSPS